MNGLKHVKYKNQCAARDAIHQSNLNNIPQTELPVTVKYLSETLNWPKYLAITFMQLYGTRLSSCSKGLGAKLAMSVEKFNAIFDERPEWIEVLKGRTR